MAEKYGFIITMEKYCGNIPTVDYACSDGDLVYDIFTNKFEIPPEHISRYSNSDFTCARFSTEFRYHLSQLSADTILFFYYAGHGFFSGGKNYLTTHETTLIDLVETSISFEDVVLDGFRKCPANTFIAFIDACAQGVSDQSRSILTRGFGYQLKDAQLNLDGSQYALYFACSPEEKAYPSDDLEHGIWTWFLNKAFEHRENSFGLQQTVTAESLKEYLHNSVLSYIKEYFDEAHKKQTPYANISSNNDIIIYEPSQKGPPFEEQIVSFEHDFFLHCFVADLEHAIVDNMDLDSCDYANATVICNYLSKVQNLPDNWQEIVNKLQFYSSCSKRNEAIHLSLDEQIKTLEDIEFLVDSLYIDSFN